MATQLNQAEYLRTRALDNLRAYENWSPEMERRKLELGIPMITKLEFLHAWFEDMIWAFWSELPETRWKYEKISEYERPPQPSERNLNV